MNQTPLTVLVIGEHDELIQKMKEWHRQDILVLLDVIEPLVEMPPADIANGVQPIDIIVLGKMEPIHQSVAKQYEKQNTLLITIDTFWVLEKMMDQIETLYAMTKDEKLYQTILMYSHEGVQYVDAEGIIRYVNPAFSRITNIAPEERLGKHIEEFSPNGALNRALKTRAPVIGLRSSGVGSNVETISNAAPIFVEDEFIGAVTTLQDITEIKYLSQQLQERDQEEIHQQELREAPNESRYTFDDIIGESNALQQTIQLAKKASRTRSTVLITSESGTGKELFAHAIHAESEFNDKPYIIVNCAAIPENLLESELFGHEKGAFTNAAKQKIGKIELAHEGTMFLDEIGEMSLALQAKLLRVLQSREIERVGGTRKIPVNLRVIAATNRHLENQVAEGTFREDLYYRLNVVRLQIPPLRERKEDIPLLVQTLMKRISQRIGSSPMDLTNKGIALLGEYDWPGNIRELENVLERLMVETTSSVIPDSLVGKICRELVTSSTPVMTAQLPTPNEPPLPLRVLEKEHIRKALRYYGMTLDGKKKAARALGISIATLYNKINMYQLQE